MLYVTTLTYIISCYSSLVPQLPQHLVRDSVRIPGARESNSNSTNTSSIININSNIKSSDNNSDNNSNSSHTRSPGSLHTRMLVKS